MLKITGAISILRTIDPDIDSVLANFEDHHKVELSALWKRTDVQYADGEIWLLDREKRDFKKAFNTTPRNTLR